MDIQLQEYKDITVVTLSKDIDLYSAPFLRKQLKTLHSSKKNKIIFNFENVSYIDSSGLSVLVGEYSHQKQFNYNLKFINLSEKIKKYFDGLISWKLLKYTIL